MLPVPLMPFPLYRTFASQMNPPRRPILRNNPPEIVLRYSHPLMTPENAAIGYIPPYTTDYTPKLNKPGWKMFLHPQGTTYFHYKEKNIVTNVNIFDDNNLKVVEEISEQLFLKIEYDGESVPPDTQLLLEIRLVEGLGPDLTKAVGYYFASTQSRCLFWIHNRPVDPSVGHTPDTIQSYTHIGHDIEQEFWLHYKQFPHAQTFSPQLVREVKGLLSFMAAEWIFDDKTVVSWNAEEINTMTSIIHSIPDEVMDNKGETCFEAACYHYVVGGLMLNHANHKFRNYHGLPNARYLRDQFMFEDTNVHYRMTIIPLISPALFYTPTKYLRSLETIISEEMIFFEAWRRFVTELHQEWNGLAIFATVLLATNVAFLAIPSVDNGDHPEKRSAAQICSYLSIVLSVGSVALGQLISRYHRIKGLEYLDERITGNADLLLVIGCHKLAIVYSLPYATLCWSAIIFLVAFLIMCFDGTTILVRCLIGVTSAILVLAVVYCIYIMHKGWPIKPLLSWIMGRRLSPPARIPHPVPDPVELQNHPLSRPPSV